jgi:hypothetical protein
LLVEPGGPVPLIRLLLGTAELARIAGHDPTAHHVRHGLGVLARVRRPDLAAAIAAFLNLEAA